MKLSRYQYTSKPGITSFPKNLINFSILNLQPQKTVTFSSQNREVGLVLLEGTCTFTVNGKTHSASRSNVFTEKPSALYLPPNTKVYLKTKSSAEIALCKHECLKSSTPPIFIGQDKIKLREAGEGSSHRQVHDIFHAGQNGKLMIGETYHSDGTWSSIYPNDDPEYFWMDEEMTVPEVYFFKFSPPTGFGLQWLQSEKQGKDEAASIKHNQVNIVPYGRHPVVVAPQFQMYYLWFYVER